MSTPLRNKLQAENPDAELLFMTEEAYDRAIVRVTRRTDPHTGEKGKAVVYNTQKVIEINVEQGMTYEEAVEWFDYNQAGAYVGISTPIFI